MDTLMKVIRTAFGLSQERFASLLGTTFATVIRWENGRAKPGKMAQDIVFDLCEEQNIPLIDLVMAHINEQAKIDLPADRVLLYHGSKRGIEGEIAPISRNLCDFGKGFYMGTDPLQPLTLVCDFKDSKFYVVSIALDELATLEVPADLTWAMLVAYHRGKMEHISGTPLYNQCANMAQGKDVLIGPIANDRMFYVLDNFFLGNITDVALVQSLSALQLGRQYVATTKNACAQVRIEKEIPLSILERRCLQDASAKNRVKGVSLADEICKNHRREGIYFDEILDLGQEVK